MIGGAGAGKAVALMALETVGTAPDQRVAIRPVVGTGGLAVMVVEAAGIAFAIPAQAVAHVNVPVPVTPLPLVPDYVEGLVGLGGAILPQIDLRRRLALPTAGAGEPSDLLVVMADEGDYALKVDRVVTLTAVARESIQVFEVGSAVGGSWGLASGVIAGEFPWRHGRTVLLLHPDRLGLQAAVGCGGGYDAARRESVGGAGVLAPPAPIEPHHVYVVARCGPGCFAVPVGQVVEVVPAGPVTPVPGAPAEVLGLVQWRGRPLPALAPVVLAAAPGALPGVFIVVDAGCGRFALGVDAVMGVRRFPLSRIHAGADAGGSGEGRAGYVVDVGDRVIGLLDIDELAAANGAAGWRPLLPQPPASAVVEEGEITRQVLLFRVGSEWCALDVVGVVKLTPYRVPVPVPPVPVLLSGQVQVPAIELAGVVEIDAEVLPAIDLRTAMALPATVDDWTAMIVVAGGDGRWAMAVDRIDRLTAVAVRTLRPAETRIHPAVTHIVRVGDRLVSLLDLTVLFRV